VGLKWGRYANYAGRLVISKLWYTRKFILLKNYRLKIAINRLQFIQ
jgi:hypothetical protein